MNAMNLVAGKHVVVTDFDGGEGLSGSEYRGGTVCGKRTVLIDGSPVTHRFGDSGVRVRNFNLQQFDFVLNVIHSVAAESRGLSLYSATLAGGTSPKKSSTVLLAILNLVVA